MNSLDLFRLIPKTGEFTDNFSLTVVILLLIIFLMALLFVLNRYFRARNRINFIFKIINEIKTENLISKRRDIKILASKDKECGSLWNEFDETLVESFDKNKLYNTFDAEQFFNTHTLAGGLTENRLIAAIPGILTAFGVIGTFVGLQFGLQGLSFGNSQETMMGIQGMISGASVAFMTSIWGVALSVLFNMTEKFLEQNIRRTIKQLQNKIDYIYPRVSPEQALVDIAGHNSSSNEILHGLAE